MCGAGAGYIAVGSEQSVSVREYRLRPRQFTPSEIRVRQSSFRDRATPNDGKGERRVRLRHSFPVG